MILCACIATIRLLRQVRVFVLGLMLFTTPSLVFAAVPAPHNEFVYFGTSQGDVLAYSLSLDGKLKPLPAPLDRVHITEYPIDLAVHPSGRFLYAATVNDQSHKGTLYSFRVGVDGGLVTNNAPRHLKPSIGQLVVHPSGRYLYAVTESVYSTDKKMGAAPCGNISVFAIASDGRLHDLPATATDDTYSLGQITGGNQWCSLSFTPDGRTAALFTYEGMIDEAVRTTFLYRAGAKGELNKLRKLGGNASSDDPRDIPAAHGPMYFPLHTRIALTADTFQQRVPLSRITPKGQLKPLAAMPALRVFEDDWESSSVGLKSDTPGLLQKTGKKSEDSVTLAAIDPKGRFAYFYIRHGVTPNRQAGTTLNVYRFLASGTLRFCYESTIDVTNFQNLGWYNFGYRNQGAPLFPEPLGKFILTVQNYSDEYRKAYKSSVYMNAVQASGKIVEKPSDLVMADFTLRRPVFVRQ